MNGLTSRQLLQAAVALAMVVTLQGCATSNQPASSVSGTEITNSGESTNTSITQPQLQWSSPPPMQINMNKKYDAVIYTNYGDFTLELFARSEPLAVNNFVFLAKHYYYDNNAFFRIIPDTLIQTGDPTNTGLGTPGYSLADELPPKEPFGPGIVAMANTGNQSNTYGGQFFICTGPESKSLPSQYTEFGKIIKGMSTLEKIAAISVVANPNMGGEVSMPTQNAYIESVTIQVK